MPDLLLELLSEEIPARMQRKAAGDLRNLVTNGLVDQGLTYEGAKEYWTPRRLVLDIRGLSVRSADIREEKKGPRTGAPDQAIQGFMRGAGLTSIEQAIVKSDPKKGEFFVAVIERPGRDATDIIAAVIPEIIRNFPWPKSMRWGEASSNSGSLTWVRPLQSILCTFGVETEEPEIVKFAVGDIVSSNKTCGHRFMSAGSAEIAVKRFDDYCARLFEAKVIIDAEQRKQIILTDAGNLAFAQGLELVEDKSLLEEVSGLVEWPVVLMGQFDESFLDIPPEVIQLTIRENQKCFVLKSASNGNLVNHFLLVSNITPSDGGVEVARGNGKVVNARLADAKFFWDSDLKQIASADGFNPWIEKLDEVTFHAKLGTQGEQVQRIMALAEELAVMIASSTAKSGQTEGGNDLAALAKRAAELCKADLNSAMVFEFPEVQGLMGHIYALRAGENKRVAAAIEAHYRPLGPTDDVPSDPVSIAVALADKLDLLVGFWAINEKPTGSRDPFALRRAALGIIRHLLENKIRLSLNVQFDFALNQYLESTDVVNLQPTEAIANNDDLLSFFHDRLKVYLRDKGIRHDLIDAVITPQSDDLLAITQRAEALQNLITSDEGANLLAGYKRAANILAAEEKKDAIRTSEIDSNLLKEEAEINLNLQLDDVDKQVAAALENEDYSTAMTIMATMRAPIDAFFDSVMVNDEDENIRANRLSLLNRIRNVTGKVADFSKISG
ncbi:MAG: glycine--tRNA ligase subunit beta [Hyphomicrobiales bacterium]|nr:glycine--tRNA ligase subunit beta [Hyphomicrobiales bacterium]